MPDLPKEPSFGSAWRVQGSLAPYSGVYIALCPGERLGGSQPWRFLRISPRGGAPKITSGDEMAWSYNGEPLDDLWEPVE